MASEGWEAALESREVEGSADGVAPEGGPAPAAQGMVAVIEPGVEGEGVPVHSMMVKHSGACSMALRTSSGTEWPP